MKKKIHVIIGPTASGKSAYAIHLAQTLDAEIISADAFQVYKDFNIGTGTLTTEEMNGIPHHLVNEYSPEAPYSVKHFIDDVNSLIPKIHSRNKAIIICGGSAMYLKSLLYGYTPLKRLPVSERPQGSKESLWNQLHDIDKALADKTPYQNKQRVQRYLELYAIYKKPPSELFQSHSFQSDKYKVIGLSIEKENLKEKISNRVDLMIAHGLVDEVHTLMEKYNHDSPAFNAIGYKEVIQYLQGKFSKDFMIDLIKKNTIYYAKKQMTWFRIFDDVHWINQ